MEYNDDRQFDPVPTEPEEVLTVSETPVSDIPVPETPVFDAPAGEPEPEDTAWHGVGVGQQEVFTPAPSDTWADPEPISEPIPEPIPEPVPEPNPEPVFARSDGPEAYAKPHQQKKRKKSGRAGKRILAAALAALLVAGSCGATAWYVSERWEDRLEAMESQMDAQLGEMQSQLEALRQAQPGTVVVGSSQSGTALAPSQVYAMNVGSVVAISNQSTTNVWGQVSETASSGTGFIISADGYILSNYHVVEGASRLTVMTYMGDEYEAQLVGYDAMNDVAILKVDAEGLDPVTIGSSDELIVGDQVVAIGNPLGELTSSLSVGYISAKDRTINTDGSLINMMQTDAAINPGNSGGPLFNMKGEVIGITTAKYSGSTNSGASIEGIGFAIPIDDVMAMTEDLMTHGYLTNQAYLGVSVMDLDSSTAAMYSLPTGSYVQSVTPGSCAEIAGIQPKDIIIAVGGHTVEGNTTLQAALRKFKAGDSTTITVFRAGAELQLPITFDERPQNPDAEPEQQQPQQSGEMPSSGSFDDWYNYFYPFFGGRGG